MSENHRLSVLGSWHREFSPTTYDQSFWTRFLGTVTCGSKTTYNEARALMLLTAYRRRSLSHLPPLVRNAFTLCVIGPFIFTALERTTTGLWSRVKLYYILPTVVMAAMWYTCFQLVPNAKFMFRDRWQRDALGEDFLGKDFDHMELRRMAQLETELLALVPEASMVGDEVWWCRGGRVPLVLRRREEEYELVGACYIENGTEELDGNNNEVIRLV
ncbi:hypothetical protein EK21DRAFT_117634 [Setomelanomma holmii]|uniref:Uncharacterized protein n=1 Tax=Setomelanomma holmii TaxID=210430 RepID=A0A9P4H029_9PLEO|nr:hypothetical protein EK21DRAFT_117634 [Setomelanomma holmii]